MMIAIPTFGVRVSPRFDCAETIMIVSVDADTPPERHEIVAAGWTPRERINRLIDLGVGAVVCGGIDLRSAESFRSAGIVVYSGVVGDVDEALAALLRGDAIRGGEDKRTNASNSRLQPPLFQLGAGPLAER